MLELACVGASSHKGQLIQLRGYFNAAMIASGL